MAKKTIDYDKTIAGTASERCLLGVIAFFDSWVREEWVRFGWRKIGH